MPLVFRDSSRFALHARWGVGVVVGLLVCAAVFGYVCATCGAAPRGGSRLGLVFGTMAGVIVLFELLLWPRKQMRRWRLVRTKRWMAAHIWLGLAVVPLALFHAGGRLGGELPTALLAVLGLVVLSGVYGMYLQWVLPGRLTRDMPDEVPAVDAERVLKNHTAGAADRLRFAAPDLRAWFDERCRPFLTGQSRDTELGCPRRAADLFLRLRTGATDGRLVDELARLCDLRRQLDAQARLHWWLHCWVPVHLALSVALLGLLVAHVITAVKFI